MKCPSCGRFARWDAYRGWWYCDFDERLLPKPPEPPPPPRPPGWRPIGASLAAEVRDRPENDERPS